MLSIFMRSYISREPDRNKGLSLTEIMVVTAIILVMASIGTGLYIRAKSSSDVTACVGNLRNLSQAVQLYFVESRRLLSDMVPIRAGLGDYGVTMATLLCPADRRTDARDSYSRSYIGRRKNEADDRLIATCGRHMGGTKATMLLMNGTTPVAKARSVTYSPNSGSRPLAPGAEFGNGTLTTGDGSKIILSDLSKLPDIPAPGIKPDLPLLVASYWEEPYWKLILYLPANHIGKFTITATEWTKIEVLTDMIKSEVFNGEGVVELATVSSEVQARVQSVGGEVSFLENRTNRSDSLTSGSGRSVNLEVSYLETYMEGIEDAVQMEEEYMAEM
ncbi:MAG: prepilin-type N-terminal cleavage/methylation domain-containing protein [Planctomycetota bacterium]|nr:prepilin-type N-terminal cleavage/methylation domain-containing protein [Planctomycetota bacterium]MDP7248335.1 prepilin-type N-terminal cleavage/methylation domain-containing protein [Planctomycetota bacterium]